ncbi:MAG TPA: hypothetical protein VLJ78_11770 [Microvirga sp.]|jgi:hypothetical protein|nr:hypothetical protein [Microvirga sp.]
MKITTFVKFALAFALIGSAMAGTMAIQKDDRIVVARAGDPTQW